MLRRVISASRIAALVAFGSSAAPSQIADSAPAVVADIPVNYTEANAGKYSLPDALMLKNGKRVTSATTWVKQRRPEIRTLIEETWFGRSPGRPSEMKFEVVEKGAPAFDGKAVRRQVAIHFTKDPAGPRMDLLLYLPANAKKPSPVFLNMSFFANNLAVADPNVRVGRRWDRESRTQVPALPAQAQSSNAARRTFPVEQFLASGIGVATFNKDDLAPDFTGSEGMGVKGLYLKPGATRPADNEWGAIAAWAWGASRALDYLESDKDVDARRVIIHGVSRLGKTALAAASADERFAMVVASCSGEGGAAIARRNYGETLAHMAAPSRYPYQFAGNYANYANKVNQWSVDANLLLATIAPRPVLLQTGNTDKWSDPYGEFLAAVAVEPVYKLFGKQGLGTIQFPAPGQAILNDVGYIMHDGGHGTVPSDFDVFIRFIQMHLVKSRVD